VILSEIRLPNSEPQITIICSMKDSQLENLVHCEKRLTTTLAQPKIGSKEIEIKANSKNNNHMPKY
jgi:hypothetical protein